MRTFLAVFIVVTVSADKHVTINGCLEHDVLLPCACSGRNESSDVKWQTEGPNGTQVFRHIQTVETFNDKYKDRGKAFLSENRENCSILLTNITAEDQGEYRCSFNIDERYRRPSVSLNIYACYSVFQTANNSGGVNVFKCNVKGRYNTTEIEWELDGEPLRNSINTNITQKYNPDDPTGQIQFYSQLNTTLNPTSAPTCRDKAKAIATYIGYNYYAGTIIRRSYCFYIPIMFVLGLSLLLWCRRTVP
ncbi:uncharacterized protein si:dkey-192g7.3 isoform X2 [Trematomus bernacchii]|uniref:uncharacterized protein si:dkey-192g7.3 isoform X2 n=1 Tax=Trematomus bernacchii TaxID=40690 RepID=UPI00146BE736|nr:uncharacterized protein si:dkey-192g7.3 isoform X2 [Trematomus bernacchii]